MNTYSCVYIIVIQYIFWTQRSGTLFYFVAMKKHVCTRTLLGLGRRSFHWATALAPPPPLASFSSDSRAYFIHLRRFCTSSSTLPHSIVDYLVSTCGLPSDRRTSAPRTNPTLLSPSSARRASAARRSARVLLPGAAAQRHERHHRPKVRRRAVGGAHPRASSRSARRRSPWASSAPTSSRASSSGSTSSGPPVY
jgi:hypothetical protein